ncbi:MAG: purine-cytosine permease family protein [Acidimicrobiales bacterium]
MDELTSFTVVAGDAHAEVGHTLVEPVPQALGVVDQFGLWGNLGVSLLGFTGAIFVLEPTGTAAGALPVAGAFLSIVLGTILGSLAIAACGVSGARTGAPAMVLLRRLLGARLSYVPTVINVVQLLGWGIFELVTIATAAHVVAPNVPRWLYILLAGLLTGLLTLRPLGAVRVLRRVATPAVVVVLAYLSVELLRHPLPALTHGSWSGFWVATDTVVAAAVSFAPLAADYTRHSRSERASFWGALVGYGVTQVLCYAIGLVALVTVARTPSDVYGAFVAVPLGAVGFAILAARELDQSFADVYSSVVSIQNARPLWDRRVLAGAVSLVITVLALAINISDYENFLILLGSVFVPLTAVFLIDFFVLARHRDESRATGRRPAMVVAWALGFVAYQLINPGYIGWWASLWIRADGWIHLSDQASMSASLISFAVSVVAALALGRLEDHTYRRRATARG